MFNINYLLSDVCMYFSQLSKLKGRRNRGEEINIVDINADDQIGNSAEMVAKYGTEEIAYAPSRVRNFIIKFMSIFKSDCHKLLLINGNYTFRTGRTF